MRVGVVICSHTKSIRIPNKPFLKIKGIPILEFLIRRLMNDFNVILAVPNAKDYSYFKRFKEIEIFEGENQNDPLKRMYYCAKNLELDIIIRVTHDKIFVDKDIIKKALDKFNHGGYEYLYSSYLPSGSGFEIISFKKLQEAYDKYKNKNIEHISYAIKSLNPKKHNFDDFDELYKNNDARLLIDYEEDITFMKYLFDRVNSLELKDILQYLNKNQDVKKINALPIVTIYTCAYNSLETIERVFSSVVSQSVFRKNACEYIFIDDHSEDDTYSEMLRLRSVYPELNIKIIRNEENIGLAASSNKSISLAKGKYILRIDADDFFIHPKCLEEMLEYINHSDNDVIYPSYIDEAAGKILPGTHCHHQGGALWVKKTLDEIKYNNYLRDYEGLEIMVRESSNINIGSFSKPTFFYSNSINSMSKSNLERRENIKNLINKNKTGQKLIYYQDHAVDENFRTEDSL